MEQLYHQTNGIIQELQHSFQLLPSSQKSNEVENEIIQKINTVDSYCVQLDALVFKVPASQRAQAKMRVDQLKYDVRHLTNALQLWQKKKQRKQLSLDEREQLLNHRFTGHFETKIIIDNSLEHNNSLENAHKGIDEMIFTGGYILGSLKNQRGKLGDAKNRILSIGNTLNLSNHVLRLIEKRFTEDKKVLFCGVIMTVAVMGLVTYIFVL
ncbi:probable Golgi SNAP receptor complex member 2 [Condylostylus longicornis]|uniref:probable Golgi SNAP receptor complex member 2 n=1 Tax=Condylostylus longicornis TaxID=2530218 RepID=UPI00244E2D95|nr:probable Golgi SNAP receptor complex member 2 [Condylostylus longicornis]